MNLIISLDAFLSFWRDNQIPNLNLFVMSDSPIKFLLPCTKKCLCYELAEIQNEIVILTDDLRSIDTIQSRDADGIPIREKLETLLEKEKAFKKLVTLPATPIKDQIQFVQPGNGVKILVGKEEIERFVDNIHAGKSKNIITMHSPLGKEILGKPVGYTGQVQVGKNTRPFKITEIIPYSQAKKILHGWYEKTDVEPMPITAPANAEAAAQATA